MEPKRSTPTPDTSCPRCGYDQAGIVETWRESCPLQGTCSECGLNYQWADVLSPAKRTPSWYVETRRAFPVAYLMTMTRALLPPRLWKLIPLGAIFSTRRLVLSLIVSFILVHAALLFLVMMAEYCTWYDGDAAYIVQFTRMLGTPTATGTPRFSYIEETAPAKLLAAILYPPAAIVAYHEDHTSVWSMHPALTPLALICVALPTLVPVCFALLPHSLQNYKVRVRHVFRAAILAACVSTLYFGATQLVVGILATKDLSVGDWALPLIEGLPLIPWSVWFWWSAVRHYLRIPHALAVSVLLHVIVCIILLMTPPVSQYIMRNFILTGY